MIDLRAVEAAGLQAALEAWERGTRRIEERARELAPVRRVFRGQASSIRTRLKSIEEIEADRGLRRALGLGPEQIYLNPPSTVTRRAPQMLNQRKLAPTTDLYTGRRVANRLATSRAQNMLDRRGRYELRVGRAVQGGMLGGRLRAEIFSVAARIEGRMIVSRVVSPTPYGKYQEFGTARHPAHPYLRPAAHEGREPMRADVGRSVASAVRASFNVRIDVTIQSRLS